VKVLVEGVDRARIEKLEAGEYYSADLTLLPDGEAYDEREMDVLGSLGDLAVRAVRQTEQEGSARSADCTGWASSTRDGSPTPSPRTCR
jgi:hypothetical protein